MKYFSALADAEFARAAFAAAGLDFDALKSAKSIDCLKTSDAKSAAEVEQVLATAKKENDELAAKLTAAQTAAQAAAKEIESIKAGRESIFTSHKALVDALAAGGITFADADFSAEKPEAAAALKSKIELGIAKSARAMVARAGHPGLLDTIIDDPSRQQKAPEAADKPALHGRARMQADFDQQLQRRYQREQSRN